MRKSTRLALAITFLALLLRIVYGWHLPLSGDECISLIQAAGKATNYPQQVPLAPTPVETLRSLMEAGPESNVGGVFESMKHAGMHPPLYYLMLHSLLRWDITEVFWLRMVSILFATGAVFLLFLLVRDVQTERVALWAALLMAVSFHSIHLAAMVRPYPLLAFLALLSTWLLFRLHATLERRFRNPWLWGYAVAALAGLYTLNHFLYLVAAQMLWLILMNRKQLRQLAAPATAAVLIGLGYLPWLSALFAQLRVVNSGDFYFHGQALPVKFLVIIYEQLFLDTWAGRFSAAWFLLIAAAFPCGLFGLLVFFRNPKSRPFLWLAVLYALIHLLADRILVMQTFTGWKFLFFMVPVTLAILAGGLIHCFGGKRPLKGLAVIVLAALLWTSLRGFSRPETYDGPTCLKPLKRIVQKLPSDERTLVIISHPNRRYVLSTANVLNESFDLMALTMDTLTGGTGGNKTYETVIWVDFGVSPHLDPPAPDPFFGPGQPYSLQERRTCNQEEIRVWQATRS